MCLRSCLIAFALLASLFPTSASAAASDFLTSTILWHTANGYSSNQEFTVRINVHNPRSNILAGNLSVLPAKTSTSFSYSTSIYLAPSQTRVFTLILPTSSYAVSLTEGGSEIAHLDSSAFPNNAEFSIGILSSTLSLDKRLSTLQGQSSSSAFYFDNNYPFPSSASSLIGLPCVLIASYATTLLPDQLNSLKTYVGAGGSLIITGGSSWRQTLSRLPSDILPYEPQSDALLSPSIINILSSRSYVQELLPGFTGKLNFGKITLGDESNPLIIESNYGLGHIYETTFDPEVALQDNNSSAYNILWQQALLRVHIPIVRNFSSSSSPDISTSLLSGSILNELNNPSVSPTSPLYLLPLLSFLLFAYMLIAVPLNFYFLKRRRALFWITLPLLALLFTSLEYAVGFSSRGSIYLDNSTEIRLSTPGSEVVVAQHDASFALSGSHTLTWHSNTSWRPSLAINGLSSANHNYSLSPSSEVQMSNVSIYLPQTVLGLTTLPQTHAVGGSVTVSNGQITAQFVNNSSHTFLHPHLILPSKREITLRDAAFLPHTTLTFSGSLPPSAVSPLSSPYSISRDFEIINNSALLSLLSDDTDFPRLDKSIPKGTSSVYILASFPVVSDQVLSNKSSFRLISSQPSLTSSGQLDVYDLELPEHFSSVGLTSRPLLGDVGIYNPTTNTWDKGPGLGVSSVFARNHALHNHVYFRLLEEVGTMDSVVVNP